MSIDNHSLPLLETFSPADEDQLAALVADCQSSGTAVYPLGGCTSLDYGLPPSREGHGISLAKLDQVIDFPVRDLTITVQAGITMSSLAETLAPENLQLPLRVPDPERATIGGVVATNCSGPGRYGYGTIRDYVIGITAVNGSGQLFHGGGRVVKNVAGYDFCKLLTGSLGTLGLITQLTLKLKPIPPADATLLVEFQQLANVEPTLAWLMESPAQPYAIQLFSGPAWAAQESLPLTAGWQLALGLCGSETELEWLCSQLESEFSQHGIKLVTRLQADQQEELWQQLVQFPVSGDAPLVIQASMVASGISEFIAAAREIDSECSIQAHAGTGVVIVRFSEYPADGLGGALVGSLQPIAMAAHGNVTVLSNPGGSDMTTRSVWGSVHSPLPLLDRIKHAFDPANVLNPGRFIYT